MCQSFYSKAQRYLGVPFRPQGREPAAGLDCIGLALLVFDIPAAAVPKAYRIGDRHCLSGISRALGLCFEMISEGAGRSGDLLLIEIDRGRPHFAVRGPASHIHAHAGLRRIVETPGMPAEATRTFRRRN